ncbi:MAG TPA: hypothetical protein VF843_05805, partial [Streptosporangiaceae bacterium]
MTNPGAQRNVSVQGELQDSRLTAGTAPAPQTPGAALWRVREFLRPWYGQIAVMLAGALLGAGAEIVIPLLTKAAIDGPIATSARLGRGHGLLVPIGLAAIGLGIAEVALNFLRRWAQSTAIAGL